MADGVCRQFGRSEFDVFGPTQASGVFADECSGFGYELGSRVESPCRHGSGAVGPLVPFPEWQFTYPKS